MPSFFLNAERSLKSEKKRFGIKKSAKIGRREKRICDFLSSLRMKKERMKSDISTLSDCLLDKKKILHYKYVPYLKRSWKSGLWQKCDSYTCSVLMSTNFFRRRLINEIDPWLSNIVLFLLAILSMKLTSDHHPTILNLFSSSAEIFSPFFAKLLQFLKRRKTQNSF